MWRRFISKAHDGHAPPFLHVARYIRADRAVTGCTSPDSGSRHLLYGAYRIGAAQRGSARLSAAQLRIIKAIGSGFRSRPIKWAPPDLPHRALPALGFVNVDGLSAPPVPSSLRRCADGFKSYVALPYYTRKLRHRFAICRSFSIFFRSVGP